jgi:phage replication-related protein YjqB (UPF0714/DUF867 family)
MISRRAVLGTIAAIPFGGHLVPSTAQVGVADDVYPSNTALYSDPNVREGVDYARRYRRHEMFDDSPVQTFGFAKTAILAPHGGGIEAGTSELCLAIAGYHPAGSIATPAQGPTYDYWMFEGLRTSNNRDLHVTSTHCDDGIALSLSAGSLYGLGLHGCTPAQAGEPDGTAAVLVGGRGTTFKQHLLDAFRAAGFRTVDAAGIPELRGEEPDNIANRTLLGTGAQLEITTPLREVMFGTNTRAERKNTTTPLFWDFVNAARAAIARLEAGRTTLAAPARRGG